MGPLGEGEGSGATIGGEINPEKKKCNVACCFLNWCENWVCRTEGGT